MTVFRPSVGGLKTWKEINQPYPYLWSLRANDLDVVDEK